MDSTEIATAYVMAAKKIVQDLMRREGLSRSAVAEIVHASPASVTRWLSDDSQQFFDLYHYILLCQHLGIPPAAALPPAQWIGEGYQSALTGVLNLPERDLSFLLSIHRLVVSTYPPAAHSGKKKRPP